VLAGERHQHRTGLTVNGDNDPLSCGGPLHLAAQVLPQLPYPDPVHCESVHNGTHASRKRNVERQSTGGGPETAQSEGLLPAEAFFSDLPLPEEDFEEESDEPDEPPESEEEDESEPVEDDDSPEEDLASAAACLALFAERVP
jgi:hypothetical protein